MSTRKILRNVAVPRIHYKRLSKGMHKSTRLLNFIFAFDLNPIHVVSDDDLLRKSDNSCLASRLIAGNQCAVKVNLCIAIICKTYSIFSLNLKHIKNNLFKYVT